MVRVVYLLASTYLWTTVWMATVGIGIAVTTGWAAVVITSGSMSPTIRSGDVVYLDDDTTSAGALAPGTIVTYEHPEVDGKLVTHRVVRQLPDGNYRTRGDANRGNDPATVTPDRIVGIPRAMLPTAGLPVVWSRQHPWLFAIWLAVTAAAVAATRQTRPGREATSDA